MAFVVTCLHESNKMGKDIEENERFSKTNQTLMTTADIGRSRPRESDGCKEEETWQDRSLLEASCEGSST